MKKNESLYRPCAGVMLLNQAGEVFVGQRSDTQHDKKLRRFWQMPQGGIDPHETGVQAARRELWEETGVRKAILIAEYPGWLYYDLPPALKGGLWNGRYIGQKQTWFCFRFTGTDQDICIDGHGRDAPEFIAWRWSDVKTLQKSIVPFKSHIYEKLTRFYHALASVQARGES